MKSTNILFSALVVLMMTNLTCQTEQGGALELVMKTKFEYKLEQREALNFTETSKANGLDNASLLVKTLKQDRSSDSYLDAERYLAHYWFNKLSNEDLKFEAVPAKESTKLSLQVSDTTIIEEDFERGYLISSREIWKVWDHYQIEQSWHFDTETEQLMLSVAAITPIHYDQSGKAMQRFSIPINQTPAPPKSIKDLLNKEDHIWIKETSSFVSFHHNQVSYKDSALLKKIFWDHVIKGKTALVYKDKEGNLERFEPSFLQKASIDTVVTFDPLTYEEQMKVFAYPIVKYEDIVAYNIEQIWYLDESDSKLKCQLKGVEPLVWDNFRQEYRALFYWR